MMSETEYFLRRAEQEAKLAQQATNPAAVAAHYRLSSAYLERVQTPNSGQQATTR